MFFATRYRLVLTLLWTGLIAMNLSCGSAQDDTAPGTLNLDTMKVETSVGMFEPERVQNASVGAVSEKLFIAVVDSGDDEAPPNAIHLCNQGVGIRLDETAPDDPSTFRSGDTVVEVERTGEGFGGTVTLPNGDSGPFTAGVANGDAGLYLAEETFDGDDYVGAWIILEDERQRGWWGVGWDPQAEEEEPMQL